MKQFETVRIEEKRESACNKFGFCITPFSMVFLLLHISLLDLSKMVQKFVLAHKISLFACDFILTYTFCPPPPLFFPLLFPALSPKLIELRKPQDFKDDDF